MASTPASAASSVDAARGASAASVWTPPAEESLLESYYKILRDSPWYHRLFVALVVLETVYVCVERAIVFVKAQGDAGGADEDAIWFLGVIVISVLFAAYYGIHSLLSVNYLELGAFRAVTFWLLIRLVVEFANRGDECEGPAAASCIAFLVVALGFNVLTILLTVWMLPDLKWTRYKAIGADVATHSVRVAQRRRQRPREVSESRAAIAARTGEQLHAGSRRVASIWHVAYPCSRAFAPPLPTPTAAVPLLRALFCSSQGGPAVLRHHVVHGPRLLDGEPGSAHVAVHARRERHVTARGVGLGGHGRPRREARVGVLHVHVLVLVRVPVSVRNGGPVHCNRDTLVWAGGSGHGRSHIRWEKRCRVGNDHVMARSYACIGHSPAWEARRVYRAHPRFLAIPFLCFNAPYAPHDPMPRNDALAAPPSSRPSRTTPSRTMRSWAPRPRPSARRSARLRC